tara:strand:- start:1173 stop:3260 length:2088 start_codon:yes stop_codon:yes gene_type:complete
MANILEVILKGDAKHLNSSLGRASRSLKSFGSQVTDVGKNLSLKLSAPLALVGTKALSSAMNFQKLQTQLDVLTGSAEAGADAFARLVKFSAGTPFQLDELVKANNTLMGFGVSAEDAFQHLQSIGDIAAVSGGDLQGISVAFGQVAAAGRLMGQDLLQLINNGVPIIDMLSKSMGVAKSEIKDMVSEGAVTFPVLIEAFRQATTEGGKFEGGMGKLSQTLGGVLSTLKDNLNIAFAELGKEIINAFDLTANMQKFIDFIKGITEHFRSLEPQTKKIVIAIGALAVALPPLLIVLGSIISAVGTLTAAFGALNLVTGGVVLAIGALAAALAAVSKHNFLTETIEDLNVELEENKKLLGEVKEKNEKGAAAVLKLHKAERELLKTELKLKKAQQDKEQGLVASLLGIESEEYKKLAKEIAKTEQEIIGYDNTIKLLEDSLKNVGNQADNTKNKITQVKDPIRDLVKEVSALTLTSEVGDFDFTKGERSIADIARGAQTIPLELDIKVPSPEIINEKLKASLDTLKATTKQTAAEISIDFGNMAMGVADALGSALVSGENVFATIGGIILNSLADIMLQLGTAAVAAANLSATFATPAGLVTGLIAIGLAGALKAAASQLQNVQSFAKGGIVSAPTLGLMGEYAGARSNPEVIAPLDRLKGMIGQRESSVNVTGGFRLEGQDLVVALQRAERNRSRL